jgi:hypothetical protein
MVKVMNDDTKRVILQDAYATLDRLGSVRPREPTVEDEDPIARWRKGVEQQEREFAAARAKRKAEADAENDITAAWQAWVGNEIRNAVRQIGQGLGEILSDELNKIGEALDKKDQRISQLECDLLRTQAQLERLNARVIQGEVERSREQDKVIDLPPLPKRQDRFN